MIAVYWIWGLVFCADCYIKTIPMERAEQISTLNDKTAANAIDGSSSTNAMTQRADPAWLRVYFKNVLTVETVKIVKSKSYDVVDCVYHVSVYDGDAKTPCGTYNVQSTANNFGYYYNQVVSCEGKKGDSVMLEQKSCSSEFLLVSEINAYTTGKIRPKAKYCI